MLALWEYNWTWGTPTPTPTPTPAASNLSNAGGGGKKKRVLYQPASEDFWQTRERYLRRFVQPVVEPVRVKEPSQQAEETQTHRKEDGRIVLMRQAMEAAMSHAQNATSHLELKAASLRAMQLALDISKIKQQYTSRAIALLLLDVL